MYLVCGTHHFPAVASAFKNLKLSFAVIKGMWEQIESNNPPMQVTGFTVQRRTDWHYSLFLKNFFIRFCFVKVQHLF